MFCDLVQCYKIVHKQVDLPVDNLFSFDINSHNIRGHFFRLKCAGSFNIYLVEMFFPVIEDTMYDGIMHVNVLSPGHFLTI